MKYRFARLCINNIEKINRGDVFYIPAKQIHAICKGTTLAEIQQTSDITYRVYDWDRVDEEGNPRELHIDEALDIIDYAKHPDYKTNYKIELDNPSNIITCPYFTTNLINIDKPIDIDYHELDSFVIVSIPVTFNNPPI